MTGMHGILGMNGMSGMSSMIWWKCLRFMVHLE